MCIRYAQKKNGIILNKKKSWQGSKNDIEDGFIHLSDREQVNKTLKRYFLNQKNLILLILKTDSLSNLIWEKSTNGEKFPHLYSNLHIDSVLDSREIIGDQYLF